MELIGTLKEVIGDEKDRKHFLEQIDSVSAKLFYIAGRLTRKDYIAIGKRMAGMSAELDDLRVEIERNSRSESEE